MKTVLERFLKYIQIESTSLAQSKSVPSSSAQLELGKFLVQEMKDIGIEDANMDDNGYVFGTISANAKAPVLGLIAHIDTVDDLPNKNIKPRVINYSGGDIVLNEELDIVMSPKVYTHLDNYVGQSLVVTDGTTILGADDKAGVAEILTLAETLINNSNIKHGEIKIGFTPDEEIGRGADYFNVDKFGAKFAYTVDGGEIGGIEYENFNAASAVIEIKGENIHPGSSKNKMINALNIAVEFENMLPCAQKPQFTENYEGFFHLIKLNGTVENARMDYIIRDHSLAKFEQKKQVIEKIAQHLNFIYGEGCVSATVKDSYYNMQEKVKPYMFLIENAKQAFSENGIEPIIEPIRGGTDGCRLSYMGLPCPNLSTGGHNFHGKYEYVSVQSMEKMVDVLINLVGKFVEE